ncbi:LysR substrate-binding domain-containing protein [Chitiniphilus purpureus]|uniref:LysR substrate-binding domain-containing protein n=1 Tax=Chitiniphilus purpureus TaxID=2981137 RepID=A0ABY6DJC5_9NEIS|nr:LysR substrate-binding domain-containing protein [Chitiniphilus sp. CD1]UXY13793.1 LysR substrate-binding domain-containing protein [Chitiniphilus sp. CD1]
MDTRLWRAFVTLADLGHFGRAASALHITQPTLSKQLQALEQLVGGPLFQRGRHGAALTVLGELLLPDARRLLADSAALLERARQGSQGLSGRLRIGFGLSTLTRAPTLVARFRERHPGIAVTLDDFSSAEQQQRLLAQQLDIGFMRLPEHPALAAQALFEEQLALVLPANLADPVRPDDFGTLNRLGFVALSPARGPGLDAQIRQWSAAQGFSPRITQYAADLLTVHAAVAAGLGVALLPFRGIATLHGGTQVRLLDGPHSHWPVALAWSKDSDNPAVARFVAFLREATNDS